MQYNKAVISSLIILQIGVLTSSICAQDYIQKEEPSKKTSAPDIQNPQEQRTFLWEFNPKVPVIQTNLAAFLLQGKRMTYQLNIPDLDIVITSDNKRLIPLLRLLRFLEVPGQIKENKVIFKFEIYHEAVLDLSQKTIIVNDETSPLNITIATSDVTNMAEIYVSEDVLKKAFGFDYVWSDADYGYTIKIEKELEIFKKLNPPSESALSVKVKQLSEILKETEPPVYPKNSKSLLSFFQTELYTDFTYRKEQETKGYRLTARPAFTFWGNLFNGDYTLKIRKDINYPDTRMNKFSSWLDSGLWTSKNDKLLVNVGDTNFGLSDLVAPAVNLFGASFTYLAPHAQTKQTSALRDKFFKSKRGAFLSAGVFEGYALLGSNVELWINNRLVDSKVVNEVGDAALGYGTYRFDGVGLLEKSLNQVKIVITRPDGVKEEFHREVLGTAQLLPQGQWAYAGGAGTHKERVSGNIVAKGEFLGAQALYGVFDWMTVGFTAATQDKFAVVTDELNNSTRSPRGYYEAQEIRCKLADRIFTKADLGVSYVSDNNDPVTASKFDLEYYLERSILEGTFFSFGPKYSNGITSVSDRQGYTASWLWKIFENWLAETGFLHIRNNLNGDLANTQQENLTTSSLLMPGFLPRSNLELQWAHSERVDNSRELKRDDMYTLEMENRITAKLGFKGRYTFGDKIVYADDLKSGLSIPSISSYYTWGKEFGLNYKIDPFHTLEAKYWNAVSYERIELNSIYNHYDSIIWSSRLNIGTDLITSKPFIKEFLEFNLGQTSDNRFGIKAEYDTNGNNYSIGFYVTLRDLFFVSRRKITHVVKEGISPETGGISGVVYLDINWNGHRDPQEPGVPNIKILLDGNPAGESDKEGRFFISRRGRNDSVTICLDPDSLPAMYIPNQGMQKAFWKEGLFTNVNLGVCVAGSISGKVHIIDDDGQLKDASGVKVLLLQDDQKTITKDSVTSDNGDFYMGEIGPGNYFVSVDTETICERCEPIEQFKQISFSTETKPQDIEKFDILLKLRKIEEPVNKEEPVKIAVEEKKSFFPKVTEWYMQIQNKWRDFINTILSRWRH